MYSYSWSAHVRTQRTLTCLFKIAGDTHFIPRSKTGTCEGSVGGAPHVYGSNSDCCVTSLNALDHERKPNDQSTEPIGILDYKHDLYTF